MNYLLLKQLHWGLAAVSISGFILRWIWKLKASPMSGHRVTRIAPHVVDTLFLLTGIMLAGVSAQYPWSDVWLGAKIGGLVVYIAFGMAAMSLKSRLGQSVAFILAVLTFAWIVTVARTKSPLGFIQGLL